MIPVDKAWMYTFTWSDYPFSPEQVVYADSSGKAKSQAINRCEMDRGEEWFNIRVKRCKDRDLFVPDIHPIGKELSEKEKGIILHTCGLCDIRNKRDPYRNHYVTYIENKDLAGLVGKGLMDYEASKLLPAGEACYYLTDLGLTVAKSFLKRERAEIFGERKEEQK